jgi:hypothetical protein
LGYPHPDRGRRTRIGHASVGKRGVEGGEKRFVAALEEMPVAVEGELDRRMTEALLDLLGVDAP